MTKPKYELINNQRVNHNKNAIALGLLSLLAAVVFFAVFALSMQIYGFKQLSIPQKSNDIPQLWHSRIKYYSNLNQNAFHTSGSGNLADDEVEQHPSKLGNYIYSKHTNESSKKLVCYYTTPRYNKLSNDSRRPRERSSASLKISDINPYLCTHLNIGIIEIDNCSLVIDADLIAAFKDSNKLKDQNGKLKVLVWVGGADESMGFKEMVENHANRKRFIQSLEETLQKYSLDGVDLDWEFPNGSNSQRIHFMQLLHEIRREYQREHSTYLLSLAAAAPSVLVDLSYDVRMVNENVDFVNLMTYDYHFYSRGTPYVGLNAPLYSRSNEVGFFASLNINYSVNYWISKGLDRSKIVIGLPTYGHSFRLVNPFNTRIGAPSDDFGRVGVLGFVSYSDVCWFLKHNIDFKIEYDEETCSPFLSCGLEWISFENSRSIECKANYAVHNNVGGVMVFSLNTDDYQLTCDEGVKTNLTKGKQDFPLLRRVHEILFQNATN